MPLTFLKINDTGARDLTPLAAMRLETLILNAARITKGLDVARNIKSISKIGWRHDRRMHPVDFWKKFDADVKKREAEKAKAEGGKEVL